MPTAPQTAANSASVNTRSRLISSVGLFVPTTGLASQSPSPIAHEKRADSEARARLAAKGPFCFAILPSCAATSARVTRLAGSSATGDQRTRRCRSTSCRLRGFNRFAARSSR
jgi:hypothetical protein